MKRLAVSFSTNAILLLISLCCSKERNTEKIAQTKCTETSIQKKLRVSSAIAGAGEYDDYSEMVNVFYVDISIQNVSDDTVPFTHMTTGYASQLTLPPTYRTYGFCCDKNFSLEHKLPPKAMVKFHTMINNTPYKNSYTNLGYLNPFYVGVVMGNNKNDFEKEIKRNKLDSCFIVWSSPINIGNAPFIFINDPNFSYSYKFSVWGSNDSLIWGVRFDPMSLNL